MKLLRDHLALVIPGLLSLAAAAFLAGLRIGLSLSPRPEAVSQLEFSTGVLVVLAVALLAVIAPAERAHRKGQREIAAREALARGLHTGEQ
ncbi:hypothetical protein [Streptomyces lydicus]|uniref:hypothetical protein n=1 Tax=Streptomyces lydicus TaxID=47763 RepID=UPI001011E334|nr:hypothetical protein [Streptomyces lydicus]MCZ1012252.1 hypothetical protein [Streptomyces lydicus]